MKVRRVLAEVGAYVLFILASVGVGGFLAMGGVFGVVGAVISGGVVAVAARMMARHDKRRSLARRAKLVSVSASAADASARFAALSEAASRLATSVVAQKFANPGPSEFGGHGFAVGTVRGARSWNIDKLGRLVGVTHSQTWTPGVNDAECRKFDIGAYFGYHTDFPDSPRPLDHDMTACGHGFYAYYEGSNDYGTPARVSGVIEGFGETIIGTRGFRSMKARIVALTFGDDVTDAEKRLIQRNYPDVPVFDTFTDMVAAYPPDADGQDYGPDSDPDFWVREP